MTDTLTARQKVENFVAANRIVDLEWRFSISTANSVIENRSDCLLYLKIVSEDTHSKRDVLNLELTVSQFFEIFNELQKMKSMVEFVS